MKIEHLITLVFILIGINMGECQLVLDYHPNYTDFPMQAPPPQSLDVYSKNNVRSIRSSIVNNIIGERVTSQYFLYTDDYLLDSCYNLVVNRIKSYRKILKRSPRKIRDTLTYSIKNNYDSTKNLVHSFRTVQHATESQNIETFYSYNKDGILIEQNSSTTKNFIHNSYQYAHRDYSPSSETIKYAVLEINDSTISSTISVIEEDSLSYSNTSVRKMSLADFNAAQDKLNKKLSIENIRIDEETTRSAYMIANSFIQNVYARENFLRSNRDGYLRYGKFHQNHLGLERLIHHKADFYLIFWKYNSDKQLTTRLCVSGNGQKILSYRNYEYNDLSQLVKAVDVDKKGRVLSETRYEYHKNGLIKSKYIVGSDHTTEFIYN